MKNISKIITIGLIAFASVASISAQAAEKIGYVNTGELLQKLPQMQQLKKKLETQGKSKSAELEKLQKNLEAKINKLQTNAQNMKQSDAQKLDKEIRADQEKLNAKAKQFQTEMSDLERSEMKKVNERIQKAIDSVAKSGGYDFILNGQALAYAIDSADVTDEVLKLAK